MFIIYRTFMENENGKLSHFAFFLRFPSLASCFQTKVVIEKLFFANENYLNAFQELREEKLNT